MLTVKHWLSLLFPIMLAQQAQACSKPVYMQLEQFNYPSTKEAGLMLNISPTCEDRIVQILWLRCDDVRYTIQLPSIFSSSIQYEHQNYYQCSYDHYNQNCQHSSSYHTDNLVWRWPQRCPIWWQSGGQTWISRSGGSILSSERISRRSGSHCDNWMSGKREERGRNRRWNSYCWWRWDVTF